MSLRHRIAIACAIMVLETLICLGAVMALTIINIWWTIPVFLYQIFALVRGLRFITGAMVQLTMENMAPIIQRGAQSILDEAMQTDAMHGLGMPFHIDPMQDMLNSRN